jgi:glycosyltransferase involved in cell wall biosynthesis
LYYKDLKNVIVEGEILKLDLLNHTELKNVKVIPNFKDFPEIETIEKERKSSFSFVYIGRISKSKGIMEIIDAAKELQKTGFEFRIDFFGPLEEDFDFSETFVDYKGFLDFQKQGRESYEFISNYNCMLFPTYWQGEGFPGVIIDAFIAGLPVIASDWNMNRELIEEGVNGFIIPAKSKEALYEKMKFVMNNENILKEIRLNNILKAKKYHIDSVYTQLKDVLI